MKPDAACMGWRKAPVPGSAKAAQNNINPATKALAAKADRQYGNASSLALRRSFPIRGCILLFPS
jgi:hypothetical protein